MPRSPIELTDNEVQGLMKSFIKGKKQIDEKDAMVLVRWANETRLRQCVLSGMLAGALQPVVEGNAVKVQLAPAATGRVERR